MNNGLNKINVEGLNEIQDYRRIIYMGTLIGGILLMIFAVIDSVIFDKYIDSVFEAIGAFIFLIINYAEKKSPVKPWVIMLALMVSVVIIGVGVFANHSADGTVIWLLIFPFVSFFLFGEKQGLFFSSFISTLFISVLTFFYIKYPERGFTLHGVLTAIGAFFCCTLIAFFYEKNRTKAINLLMKQAKTDPLTFLLNRRGLMDAFNFYVSLCRRTKQELCLFILDLDYFKLINDNYGHDVGDIVIIKCANTIKSTLRDIDSVARLGGEEYIALLPNTSLAEAEKLAERIRESIENIEIKLPDNQIIHITASIGVTDLKENRTSFEALYKTADEALYQAKSNGRNCFVAKN